MKKITVVIGTRPEAIKLAPVISELKKISDLRVYVILTGQHDELVKSVLELFSITADFDLDIMKAKQSLSDVTTKIISGLGLILSNLKPDLAIVHGDTSTTFASALAAFYHKIEVWHVEAGLRTHDILSPWPEEANRRLVSCIASKHFAPTIRAQQNLIHENIKNEAVYVSGNTVIDALMYIDALNGSDKSFHDVFYAKFNRIKFSGKLVLVTVHRRENIGQNLVKICDAVFDIAKQNPDIEIAWPMHPNPDVRKVIVQKLSNAPNIHLTEPFDYREMVQFMRLAHIIMTDSGGIQEEAPSFHKPILVLRETTERPEGIEAGTAILVGSDAIQIREQATKYLSNKKLKNQFTELHNPYGDGKAAKFIATKVEEYYN